MRDAIITSSVLIICIALLRQLCKGKISAGLQYMLWLVVAVRLMVPGITIMLPDLLPKTEFSIMNAADKVEGAAQDYMQQMESPTQFNLNLPIGALPMLTESDADGPTAVFLAGSFPGAFSWFDFLRLIWYAGMAAVGGWMMIVNILFMHKLRKNRTRYVREDFKLPIYLVKGLDSPCLYGIPGRQAVYLPEDVSEDEEKIRHILAHEYCHYRHRDVIWSAIRCILLVVYWFHPLVWLAAVLSRQDCELACDEASIRLLGEEERIAYGKTLLALITRKTRASDIMCTATTMTGGANGIKERIRRVAENPHKLAILLIPVIVVVGVTVVFTFTQAKGYPRDARFFEGEESLAVATDCFQMTFPEAFEGSAYYRIENDTSVIVYHKNSDQEVGRFCKVPYGEAMQLADEKEVALVGIYGSNLELQFYLNRDKTQEAVSAEEHLYEPESGRSEGVPGTDSNSAETTYILEEDIQKNGKVASESSGGLWHIPAPEAVESELIPLPYEEDEEYKAEDVDTTYVLPDESIANASVTPMEESHDYLPNEKITETDTPEEGISRTEHQYYASDNPESGVNIETNEVEAEYDDTTYVLPDESIANVSTTPMEESHDYLPNEKITETDTPEEGVSSIEHLYYASESPESSDIYLPEEEQYCYLYISADYADAEDSVQNELTEMNQLLIQLADSTTVLYMSKESMEEVLDILIENRTPYMSDSVKLSTIAEALPLAPGLRYRCLEMKTITETDEVTPVTLCYRIEAGDFDQIDEDVLFMNAVLMFASVENLEQFIVRMGDIHITLSDFEKVGDVMRTDKISTKEVSFERSKMEELFGPLYPCSGTKEDFVNLYNRVLDHLGEK